MSRLCSADVLTRSQCPKSHQACFVTGISCPIRSVFLQYKSVTKKQTWVSFFAFGRILWVWDGFDVSETFCVRGCQVLKSSLRNGNCVKKIPCTLALWQFGLNRTLVQDHYQDVASIPPNGISLASGRHGHVLMPMCEPAFILVENISFTSYNGEKEFEKVEERSKQLDQIIKYHQIMFQGDQYHMTTCFLFVPVHPEKNHAKKHSFFQPNTFQLILPKDQRSIIIIPVTIPPSLPPSPLPTLRCNKGLRSCWLRSLFGAWGGCGHRSQDDQQWLTRMTNHIFGDSSDTRDTELNFHLPLQS